MAIPRSEEIKDLAIKYSNKQLAQLAQRGEIDPTTAVMAGMMRDRIVKSEMIDDTPTTTVYEDTFAPKQDMTMAPAGLGATPQAAMAPTEAGVAALPVPDEMVADAYAGGGIVAFANGGTPIDYSQFGELGEELKRQEAIRRFFLGENEALKAEREGMKAAADRQQAMRMIEAGLGIAGGESPYALQNIAKGALPAIKGYGEDVAAQRKRETELAGAERAEKAKVLESAMGTSMAREKLTPETIRAAREIQEEARQNKKPVPSLAEAIKSIERSNTTTLQSAFVNARTSAAKAVSDLVNSQTFQAKYKNIEKKQGREAAEAYKEQSIRETVGLFPGIDLAEVMSVLGSRGGASAAPSKSSGTVDKNNPLLR